MSLSRDVCLGGGINWEGRRTAVGRNNDLYGALSPGIPYILTALSVVAHTNLEGLKIVQRKVNGRNSGPVFQLLLIL